MKQIHFFAIGLVTLAGITYAASRPPHKSQKADTKAQTQQQQQNQKEKYDPTPAVLNNFAHVIGGFISIVQDPNNPENVGASVANMLGHMINIAVEMTKRGNLLFNATPEDIAYFINNLDAELKAELVNIVLNKTRGIPQFSAR